MRNLSLAEIAEAIGGDLPNGGGERVVTAGVSTDTRTLAGGELFVALRGERFDGHDYLEKAFAAGVVGALAECEDSVPHQEGVILVRDTLLALQRLACWWRRLLEIPVVGLTGSNGKTSTKDFTRSVLSQRFQVRATRGNLNNHIGVPLSVLSLTEEDEVGVFEMGMNHPGEIAPLCEIARPHLGIITNIGTAHIEYMGSRDAIAEEKGALARALPEVGTLFVPAACPYLDYFRDRTRAEVVAVGNGRGEVRAEEIDGSGDTMRFTLVLEGEGRIPVNLPVAGRHMVTNALLAAAVGRALGLTLAEIARGLEATELTSGRLRSFQKNGITILDDTYNANPESMRAGLETLAERRPGPGGRHFAVLGKMAEIGATAPQEHHALGEFAAARGVRVVSVGGEARGISQGAASDRHFDTRDEAARWLAQELHEGDVVLFKGSRTAAIENVIKALFPDS
ncbi:UDP-N-acetylmuramoyl-tripeptide--D-alanyl-D-alanine ligase [Roseibacillus ishigakijimensis]|uniref:UDP-N-acetylmuramoyl-tripeptide--D-alanyl-D-alanine ligase n=1 Tax=Roseibacillus ishigakijimensis TaxID=454146 RepID=A0A934RSV7_9BACT|nr:UDP-N-acetylmuramoyl-tripeptide--D-alanyl-D-alanine ligase [Roseibacillus ishigakijimensis]MBK1835302.1 UDP-N-acetylmuramoyl-tripeptide--D-alanyl-D-alanine ligase [Roseibacillus ishigakijimensis]